MSLGFFGINAWMPHQVGSEVPNGELELYLCGPAAGVCVPAEVEASGARHMRYGGSTVDRSYSIDSPDQYALMVDNMHASDIEPILQVPVNDPTLTVAQGAAQAAELVRYINAPSRRAVTYWTIGNEPDRYTKPDPTSPPDTMPYTAADIAAYFKEFAQAMKDVDPSILITGPDLSSLDPDIMRLLTDPSGPDDITGSFTAGGNLVYYLDVINFHTYPFDGYHLTRDPAVEQTADAVIAEPELGFRPKVQDLKAIARRANRVRPDANALKTAVTEINVNFVNPPSDGAEGVGAMSFLGGQFWAETMGIGLQEGLAFMTFWSVVEGENIGYIKGGGTGTRLPTYYHFQMMAQNFLGDAVAGRARVNGVVEAQPKVFASQASDRVAVLILNQGASGPFDYSVRLNNGPVPGGRALKINVDAGIAAGYHSSQPIDTESTVLLVFDGAGNCLTRTVYSLNDAINDLEPSTVVGC
jgi:hypothetical protein